MEHHPKSPTKPLPHSRSGHHDLCRLLRAAHRLRSEHAGGWGLLIEEARTNQYLNSSDLTDANTVQHGTTKSTDGTLGPDGKSLMVKTLANAGGGFHEIYQSFSVTSGVSYASSIFVKKGNYRYVAISFEVTSGLNGFLAVLT